MTRRFIQSHIICLAMFITILAVSLSLSLPAYGSDDPWPEWQRTASRLGRTDTIGPQTPTIAWSVRVDPSNVDAQEGSTPTMDSSGRIFAGHHVGVTAVDSQSHDILWYFQSFDPSQGVSLWRGRVLFGTEDDRFYCIDAETGEEIWRRDAAPHPNLGSAIDANGIVYYASQLNILYARRVEDGSEVWIHNHPDFFNSTPALDGLSKLYLGNIDRGQWLAFNTTDGSIIWTFPSGHTAGVSPVLNGRLYVSSPSPRLVFCLDSTAGEEIWRFNTEFFNASASIRYDGVVLTPVSNSATGRLYGISPDGKELWRYEFFNQAPNRPCVSDGAGNAYFGTLQANTLGWVHAVDANGEELWVKTMPNQVSASPMLSPDGTLFIMCRDHNLYAFRDPHLRASITNLEITTGTILDGGINDIAEPDGAYLHTRSGFGTQLSELHKTELLINATVADPQPAIMRIQIESRTDQPAAMAIVQLRNWTTNRFETVRNYEVESDEEFEWIQIPKGGNGEQVNPQRYIRPSGAIEMKLKHLIFVPFLAFTFESFIDQIKIEVTG